ncbi:PQ loop repeat-domain-containing protein [Tuber borchii]|uniref:PQ loop repeat-domain-containing protein n=1 Tax=Tuber borchii TaxID=42251 RepID=A0A2T6ZF61_TUBBO|nr:PQ loop repeat-domain-containing protein [Tuber borchii]
MPAQESIPPAANVLGTIGTVLWCVQLIPQIWYNYKNKSTEGLPAIMMLVWGFAGVPFGAYAVIQLTQSFTKNLNIPIQIQPQCFASLSLISWAQCLHYSSGWAIWSSSLLALGVAAACAGAEVALILTLRPIYDRGIEWPMLIVGITASILLAAGLIPPYFEIWKRRGRVVGIDFVFLSIDWFGALFSIMSLVAQHTFDYLGGVLYLVVILLESGIFISHWVWLFRTRKQRKAEKEADATVAAATAVTSPALVDERSCDIASTTESSNKEVELKQEV